MHLTPVLAFSDKASTSVADALPHLAGMIMVMVTLAILWGVCALTAKLVHIFIPESAAAAPPQLKPAGHQQPAAPAAPAGLTPDIIAVITAAVAATTGQHHRIVSIKPMSTSWERAGRQSVLTSHRIR